MGQTRMFRDRVVSMEQTQELGEKHLPLLTELLTEALPDWAVESAELDHDHDYFTLNLTGNGGTRKRVRFTRMVLAAPDRIPAVADSPRSPMRVRIVDLIRSHEADAEIQVAFRDLRGEDEVREDGEIDAEWRVRHEAEMALRKAEEEKRAEERRRLKERQRQEEEGRRKAARERQQKQQGQQKQPGQPRQPGPQPAGVSAKPPGAGRRRRGRGGRGAGAAGGGTPPAGAPAPAGEARPQPAPQQARPPRPPRPPQPPRSAAPPPAGGAPVEGGANTHPEGGGRRRRRRGRGGRGGGSAPGGGSPSGGAPSGAAPAGGGD